jgi:hypothetical protein
LKFDLSSFTNKLLTFKSIAMAKSYAIIKKTKDPDPKPSSFTVERVNQKRKFIPEDVRTGDTKYGSESNTKPTPEFIKDAQAKEKQLVTKDGKQYRAGRYEYEDEFRFKVNPTKPDVKAIKMVGKTPAPSPASKVKPTPIPRVAPSSNKSKSKLPKRFMPRVDYLQGQKPGKLSNFEGKKRPKKQSGY